MAVLCVLVLDLPGATGVSQPAVPNGAGHSGMGHSGGSFEVRHRSLPVGEQQLATLADDLAALTEGERPVLVLYPRHRAAEILPLLRLLRLVLHTDRLVAVPTSLPPLAVGVLVNLLHLLADRLELDAGRAAAAVPELERQLVVVCWVRTVAGLHSPQPSMAQHLLGWAARRGFEVTVRPVPAIRRIGAASPPAALPAGATMSRGVALRGERRHLSWLTATLAPAGLPAAAPAPGTDRWFGTSRAAELVVFPTDLDALAALMADRLRVEDCAWCGVPGPGGRCAFCGADHPPAAPPPPPSPAATTPATAAVGVRDCAWCGLPSPGGRCTLCGAHRPPAAPPPPSPAATAPPAATPAT